MKSIEGPLNPSINYEAGLLVIGFDSPPRVMTTYNPPYYEGLFTAAGLEKTRDLYAYRMTIAESDKALKNLARAVRLLPTPDFTIRTMQPNRYAQDVDSIWHIYNTAWQGNSGAAPMGLKEFRRLAYQLKPILIPDWAMVVDVAGKPVAFGLAIPDINEPLRHAKGSLFPTGLLKILYHKRHLKSGRILALGVLEEYRETSIAAHLYVRLIRDMMKLGYTEAEASRVVEDNRTMNRTLQFMRMKRYKTYRIYAKNLA